MPCVPWLWLPSFGSWELQSHHMPRGLGSHLLAQGSSKAATCLMAPAPATKPQGSSRTATCPLGSSSHFLAHGSSGAATCPVGRLNGPRAIKVNKYPFVTQPS
jgi:hypothetical protein